MASPQLDQGYVKIANTLFEALARIRIPGEARQVLDTIIRQTYGFNKKYAHISLEQFVLATGINKSNTIRALNALEDMHIVIEKDNGEYHFVKDFDTWKPLSKKITLSKKIKVVIEKDNLALSKKIISTVEPKDIIKDTYKDIYILWNSKNIVKHTELTDKMVTAISKRLKTHNVSAAINAINNYNEVLNDKDCFFNYKWTLTEFMGRSNADKFYDLDLATLKQNFKSKKDNAINIQSDEQIRIMQEKAEKLRKLPKPEAHICTKI